MIPCRPIIFANSAIPSVIVFVSGCPKQSLAQFDPVPSGENIVPSVSPAITTFGTVKTQSDSSKTIACGRNSPLPLQRLIKSSGPLLISDSPSHGAHALALGFKNTPPTKAGGVPKVSTGCLTANRQARFYRWYPAYPPDPS